MMQGKLIRKPIEDFTYGLIPGVEQIEVAGPCNRPKISDYFLNEEERNEEHKELKSAYFSSHCTKYRLAILNYVDFVTNKALMEVKNNESTTFRNDSWEVNAQLIAKFKEVIGITSDFDFYKDLAEQHDIDQQVNIAMNDTEEMCREVSRIAGAKS